MSSSPAPISEGSFVILWAGEDPALHAALLEQLDAAGIPYADKTLGQDEVAPTADPFPIDWKPRFGFEVAVFSTDLRAGKAILEPLLESEPVDMELPLKETEAAPGLGARQELAGAGAGEKPTLQVWSNADRKLVRFVMDALRENGITARAEEAGGLNGVFVPPSQEAHAREIVREVTQGSPPE